MAVKTIQIADKPTLDATKALLEDSEVGLAAIKQAASSGAVSGSAGGLQIEKYVDEQVNGCASVSTLPYEFRNGSAVVYNDEIHILGSYDSSYYTNHYKFNGTSWESVSTIPYNFSNGSAVVYNDEIHILGSGYYNGTYPNGNYPYTKYHYKFNGSSWESVSTLPYNFTDGSAVVLNGEIHILGSGYYKSSSRPYAKYHYKYNGSSWVNVSTLPYEFYYCSAVVLNDEIHILGGETNHYTFNGTSWRKTYDAPYNFHDGSAVVLNNEIHILGGGGSGNYTKHYLVKPDNRHIATMLPKGVHILLSDNEDIIYASNAKRISSNIAEVTDTGYVELLAALTDKDNIKGYLTFY